MYLFLFERGGCVWFTWCVSPLSTLHTRCQAHPISIYAHISAGRFLILVDASEHWSGVVSTSYDTTHPLDLGSSHHNHVYLKQIVSHGYKRLTNPNWTSVESTSSTLHYPDFGIVSPQHITLSPGRPSSAPSMPYCASRLDRVCLMLFWGHFCLATLGIHVTRSV